MGSVSQNNKRIAKNTLALYFRMLVTTVVSLFTARYTLILLGTGDYGINNVVGGLIGFTSIITGTMISATERFLAYDLGKNDTNSFQEVFSMLINIFIIFSIIVVVVLEIVGPYFISHYLVIPPSRLYTAQWVFQFSLVSFVLSTILIPYTSAIISYERMSVYAYFTIIDVVGKLVILGALFFTPIDRLITLAFFNAIISAIGNIINYWYCKTRLKGCVYKKYWNNILFKEMFSYAKWNLFGSTSWVMNQQGQAIVLNMFFGPTVNAAKAVADKINQIVVSFCNNFYMAVNPQIIKTYALGDVAYTRKLVLSSSRLCFFLMVVLCIPLICNMQDLLVIWLGKKQVSSEMIRFSALVLCFTLINSLETPISQAIRATGDIKKYQIIIGIQTLTFLPITYITFKLGFPAYSSMIVLCIVYFIVHFSRVWIVRPILKMKFSEYVLKVFKPIVIVLFCNIALLYFGLFFRSSNIFELVIRFLWSFVLTIIPVFFIGLTKNERIYVVRFVKNKILMIRDKK